MKIWILTIDQGSRGRVGEAAPRIAADFHRWGVTNVEVNLTSDPSKVPPGDTYTVVVRAEANRSMTDGAVFGKHYALAGGVTVNTELANTAQSFRTTADHEMVHVAQPPFKRLVGKLWGGDHSSDPSDLMYARYDPLKPGDPQLSQGEQANLQRRFNQPGEPSNVSVIDRDT
jgi:hypothetical protein